MIERRKFLIRSAGALAAAAVPAVSLAETANPLATKRGLSAGFSKAEFEALLNAKFRVSHGRKAVFEATLAQVQSGRPRTTHEEFALIFSTTAAADVPPGIYNFSNARTGRFALDIRPAPGAGVPRAYKAGFALLT